MAPPGSHTAASGAVQYLSPPFLPLDFPLPALEDQEQDERGEGGPEEERARGEGRPARGVADGVGRMVWGKEGEETTTPMPPEA